MDFYDFFEIFVLGFKVYCYIAITLLPLYLYKTFFISKYKPNSDFYYRKEWYHFLKVLWARPYVQQYKNSFAKIIKRETPLSLEQPRKLTTFMRYDSQTIYGVDNNGNAVFIKVSLRENRLAELCFQLRLADGRIFQLPDHPTVLVCSIPERKWCAGGLEINIIEPFEKLRITFNGLLRNCIRNNSSQEIGEVIHCRFYFTWTAASEAKYFPQDTATHQLANAVAVEPWKNSKWIKLLGFQTGYDQYGMLLGQVFFEPEAPPFVLRLTGCRKRTWGPSKARTLHRTLILFGVQPNGTIFTINVKSYINGCKELQFGTMILPNKKVISIEDCDISLPDFVEDGIIPGAFSFSFQANGVTYDCTAFTCKNTIAKFTNEETKGYKSKLCKTKYMVNGEEAVGYGLFWYRHQGKEQELPSYIIRSGVQIVEPERKFVAPFQSPECRSDYLAGIKGTALALLTNVDTNKFQLLDGFCVLVPAFQQYLEENPKVKEELIKLKNICCGGGSENLSDVCNRIKLLFTETPLSEQLQNDIVNELKLLKFNSTDVETENETKFCWAVRLSTVDEDVAGIPLLRNKSFLDCFTDDDVLRAVVSCWSSVFTPEKVLYRKKRGLPIICDMAVIIQYAVDSDAAGVLTTCHPKTANPGEMIITANFGLGVSVVTNMVEPDTASITKTWNGKLKVSHTSIGSKTHKIVLSKTGVKKMENTDKKLLCLSYEHILKISEVGVLLEKSFGGPRNIEWAIFKDQLYILNMKPIRFQYDWSDFELIHENDTASLTSNNLALLNTTENIVPGLNSSLTQSICVKYVEESLQHIYSTSNIKHFVFKILTIYKQHVGVDVFESILKYVDKDITEELKIHELVSTGQSFINDRLHQQALAQNKICKFPKCILNYLKMFSYCWKSSEYAEEAKILSHAIRIISYDEFSAFEYLNVIKRNLHLLKHVTKLYMFVNYSNMCYQKLLLNLMHDEKQDVSNEQFFEMLDTYSNNSVYEMSTKVELMAVLIKNKNASDLFCKLSAKDAVLWLEENCDDVITLLKKYMMKFGHRAVNEVDLKSLPWEVNTSALIRILQLLVKKLETKTVSETSEKPKRTVSLRQKMNGRILRWIESKVENSFIYKEKTLSSLAKTVNKFRFAYRELAKKLKQEGKIPETELIFYFTQTELEQLVARKNPDLVAKAIKRMNLNAELLKNNSPEFHENEHLVQTKKSDEIDASLEIPTRIIGNTVVGGHVEGRACVLDNIREVNEIREGDILVVKNLDIGWSPFFPVVSGVVAENGCLTSQGAIAIRKRNLPSIINAKNATNIYKTGDVIVLIANNGVVEKIKA